MNLFQLAEKVFELNGNTPLTYTAIWKYVVDHDLDDNIGTRGKAPSTSLHTSLNEHIKDEGENSKFTRQGELYSLSHTIEKARPLKKGLPYRQLALKVIVANKTTSLTCEEIWKYADEHGWTEGVGNGGTTRLRTLNGVLSTEWEKGAKALWIKVPDSDPAAYKLPD